jgi:hypothetical protein
MIATGLWLGRLPFFQPHKTALLIPFVTPGFGAFTVNPKQQESSRAARLLLAKSPSTARAKRSRLQKGKLYAHLL